MADASTSDPLPRSPSRVVMANATKKSRLSAGPSCSRLILVRTSDRPFPADWGSGPAGPDGSDLAVAVRASGRRPAADRAFDPGSGSAGPGSGSGWTSESPWLNVTGDNRKTRSWFQGNFGSVGIIA